MKACTKEIDAKLKEADYTFLDWENGWDFNSKPEPYINCRDAKHIRDTIHHNHRGSENTVSCDICQIYWKYDSSD